MPSPRHSLEGLVGDLAALLHLQSAESAAAQGVVSVGRRVAVGHRLSTELDTHLVSRALVTRAWGEDDVVNYGDGQK